MDVHDILSRPDTPVSVGEPEDEVLPWFKTVSAGFDDNERCVNVAAHIYKSAEAVFESFLSTSISYIVFIILR